MPSGGVTDDRSFVPSWRLSRVSATPSYVFTVNKNDLRPRRPFAGPRRVGGAAEDPFALQPARDAVVALLDRDVERRRAARRSLAEVRSASLEHLPRCRFMRGRSSAAPATQQSERDTPRNPSETQPAKGRARIPTRETPGVRRAKATGASSAQRPEI